MLFFDFPILRGFDGNGHGWLFGWPWWLVGRNKLEILWIRIRIHPCLGIPRLLWMGSGHWIRNRLMFYLASFLENRRIRGLYITLEFVTAISWSIRC